MKKVVLATIRIEIDMPDEGMDDVFDVVNNMQYDMESLTPGAKITDTEIQHVELISN